MGHRVSWRLVLEVLPLLVLASACTSSEPAAPPAPSSQSPGKWLYSSVLTDLRLSSHEEFERVVLEFQSDSTERSWRSSDISSCNLNCDMLLEGPGEPLRVAGTAYYSVLTTVAGCRALDAQTLTPVPGVPIAETLTAAGLVREVALYDCSEGYVGVGVGLAHPSPVHVSYLDDPPRVVLDVWTAGPVRTQSCAGLEVTRTGVSCQSQSWRDGDEFESVVIP